MWALALIAVTAPTVFVSPALAQVPQAIDGVYNVQESDQQGTACEPTPFRAALAQGQTGPNFSYPLLVTKSGTTVSFSPQSGGAALFTVTIDQSGAFRGDNGSPFPVEGAFEINARGETSFRMSWIRSDGAGTCESSIRGVLSAAAGSTTSVPPALKIAFVGVQVGDDGVVSFGETVPVRVSIEAYRASGEAIDPSEHTPVKVELYQELTLIGTQLTNAEGKVEFRYTPPESTPNGRSEVLVSVIATKEGYTAAQTVSEISVERGLRPVAVTIVSAPRQAFPGDRITITGRVSTRTFLGLIESGIPATISVGDATVATEDGTFSITTTISGKDLAADDSQHLQVRAEPRDADRHASATATVVVEVQSRGRLQVELSPAKALYDEDEDVTIVGRVRSSGDPLSEPATLDLVLNGRPQQRQATAADGRFTIRLPARDGAPPGPRDGEAGGVLVVGASAPGFLNSLPRAQLFFVRRGAPRCAAGEGVVASVDGPVGSYLTAAAPTFMHPTSGSRLVRGTSVTTAGDGRVALRFRLDRGGGTATVTMHGHGNVLSVDDYCLDPSGTVRLVIGVLQPGQVRVDVPDTGPTDARWQVEVKTVGATVRNVRTSYLVTVGDDGTAVAVLAGTVQLGRNGTAEVLELTEGQGGHVPLDPAAEITTAALTGQADPVLGQLLEQAAATPAPPDVLPGGSEDVSGDGSSRSLVAAGLAGVALVGCAAILVGWRRRQATTVAAAPVGSSSTTRATTPPVPWVEPTHVVPAEGRSAWTAPDATAAAVAHLDPGLEVVVVESYTTGWARVVCSNGWSGWVDGQRLRSAR
jgi:hypothetical protein